MGTKKKREEEFKPVSVKSLSSLSDDELYAEFERAETGRKAKRKKSRKSPKSCAASDLEKEAVIAEIEEIHRAHGHFSCSAKDKRSFTVEELKKYLGKLKRGEYPWVFKLRKVEGSVHEVLEIGPEGSKVIYHVEEGDE